MWYLSELSVMPCDISATTVIMLRVFKSMSSLFPIIAKQYIVVVMSEIGREIPQCVPSGCLHDFLSHFISSLQFLKIDISAAENIRQTLPGDSIL